MKVSPGVVLGFGLGGFIDGIALHQIAQWHNMGSAVLPPHTMEAMRRNMAWDGWFHVATLAITIVGVLSLRAAAFHRRPMPSLTVFIGQMLFGWGAFNLIEGVIDHHLLQLHHVRDIPTHVPAYDWVFLAFAGVGLLLAGSLLSRAGTEHSP